MPCTSCGTVIVQPSTSTCVTCVTCTPVVPVVPECRRNIRDSCRIKPLPVCKYECPPPPCVRRTKCRVPSVRDKCRIKPCPPVVCCAPDCNAPAGCRCVGSVSH